MSNPRRLVARLNASTVRYDIGRGGVPELSAQDIAGALGMIADKFAREVFCAVWWPEGAQLERGNLLYMIALKQRAEIDRQWRAVQIARLDLHIAEEDLSAKRAASDADRRVLESIRARVEEAKRRCWPSVPRMYPVIRAAALDELARVHHCARCDGRGSVTRGELVVQCKACDGTGKAPVSDRSRAQRIGRSETTYRKDGWRAVYEWTLELLTTAEAEASRRLTELLGECGGDTPAFPAYPTREQSCAPAA